MGTQTVSCTVGWLPREDPATSAQMFYTEIKKVQDGLKMQKGSPSHKPYLAIFYAPSPRVLSAIDLMQLLKLKGDCVLTCVAGEQTDWEDKEEHTCACALTHTHWDLVRISCWLRIKLRHN